MPAEINKKRGKNSKFLPLCLYKTYLQFFSNVVSLNNVISPQPPAPFPEGEGGESGAPARPAPCLAGTSSPRPCCQLTGYNVQYVAKAKQLFAEYNVYKNKR